MPHNLRSLALAATAMASFVLPPEIALAKPTLPRLPSNSPPAATRAPRGMKAIGTVELSKVCAPEFLSWVKAFSFYERPFEVCVRWKDKQQLAWAKWNLYKKGTGGAASTLVASAAIPTAALAGGQTDFVIDLKAHLPQFNTGTVAQDYLVKVSSKLANGDTTLQWSTAGTLTQLPQAGEPVPAMVDPYTCAPGKFPRDIQIEIPQMTVNSTSSTPGDGDRDEVYMDISRIGPGTDTRQKRLPYIDLAYEAKNGQTVFENAWTDEDEKHRTNPMLWAGILEHGQTVTLAVKIGEEDNGTLADVRKGLQTALDAIADVAATVPGYGTVVAAVAKAGSAAAGLMPQNSSDDVIGFTTVQLWNKCGNVQSAWVTFHKKSFGEAGSISNDFLDIDTQDAFEARTVVLNSATQGFWTDYAPFSWAGTDDEFFWVAKGTHGSAYTFLVQQHVKPG